MVVSENAS